MIRVGSRVEIKATGRQGKLASFDYHLMAPLCTVILDDGREVKAQVLELKQVRDKAKKAKELWKKIRKGVQDGKLESQSKDKAPDDRG